MSGLALVMPMAGRGSRFARQGIREPKPLVELAGKPFFWWAVESARQAAPLRSMTFVVLDEHCHQFGIDVRIRACYPDATVVAIADVTSGAAETARIGVDALADDGPVAINDCDHAFVCTGMADLPDVLSRDADMGLLCFRSDNPAYSYAVLGDGGEPTGTIEKVVASAYAIAGCYLFSSPALFRQIYDAYQPTCPYGELFISGMFNAAPPGNNRIVKLMAQRHWSFGTPDELAAVDAPAMVAALGETA